MRSRNSARCAADGALVGNSRIRIGERNQREGVGFVEFGERHVEATRRFPRRQVALEPIVYVTLLYQLQDRSAAVLVAVCTYPMRWLGAAALRLRRVNKRSRGGLVQFVSLLCFFPCLYASQLCFKAAYLLNHRRLLRVSGERFGLKSKYQGLELNRFGLDVGQLVELAEAHRKIRGCLDV